MQKVRSLAATSTFLVFLQSHPWPGPKLLIGPHRQLECPIYPLTGGAEKLNITVLVSDVDKVGVVSELHQVRRRQGGSCLQQAQAKDEQDNLGFSYEALAVPHGARALSLLLI